MVPVGFAVTDAVLVADNAVDGVQLYVLAPDAVNTIDDPEVNTVDEGLADTFGSGFTVTVAVALFTVAQVLFLTTAL